MSAPAATAITPATLEAIDVTKRYGAVLALDGVSLRVAAGECVALVGESGSGKSTLLRCFNRLAEPDAGRVLARGADVRDADPVALRRATGYVPQEGGLLPHWTALRNAGLVPWLQAAPDPDYAAREALVLVGLEPASFGTRYPHELSGGQRQRVALARALAAHPDVVLLDEPFGALDAITRADLQATFADVRRARPVTCVLVTHDLHEALRLAERVGVLRAGRIEQVAPGRKLVSEPSTEYVARLLERAGVR
jgi:osmoprotectant transport system ATP-binding protein